MLRSRIIVAVIFIPLLLTAVVLRGALLTGVVAIAAAVACAELALMFRQRGLAIPLPGAVAVGQAFVWTTALDVALPPWLAAASVLAALWRVLQPGSAAARGGDWALAVIGGSYVGFLVSRALLIGLLPLGACWGILALLTVWAADSSAYVVGKRWGRHRLAPTISPNKTWEGALGALLGAVAATAAMRLVLPIPVLHVVPLGIVIGLVAMAGDLVESAAKRLAGVKDSSQLLAGHGGFLDRMDSLLPVLPIVYAYAVRLVGG